MQPITRVSNSVDAARHVAVLGAVLISSPVPCLVAKSHNYTWSLLIFLGPIATILHWFYRTEEKELSGSRKAFLFTLGLLVPMGFLLNLFFADDFFRYDDPNATLGWYIPALDFFSVDWEHPIPVEEFAFYTTGFIAMLLIYIWGDETFFERYQRRDHTEAITVETAIVQWSVVPVVLALVVVGGAWLFKESQGDGGFPGYLAYLMGIPFVVSVTLYRVAAPFINWRAYAFMFVVILADSVTWEVTLAIPQGWWGYRDEQMMGVFIQAWNNLPIEAVLVWVLATFATVVTFEAAKVFFYHPAVGLPKKLLGPSIIRPQGGQPRSSNDR